MSHCLEHRLECVSWLRKGKATVSRPGLLTKDVSAFIYDDLVGSVWEQILKHNVNCFIRLTSGPCEGKWLSGDRCRVRDTRSEMIGSVLGCNRARPAYASDQCESSPSDTCEHFSLASKAGKGWQNSIKGNTCNFVIKM